MISRFGFIKAAFAAIAGRRMLSLASEPELIADGVTIFDDPLEATAAPGRRLSTKAIRDLRAPNPLALKQYEIAKLEKHYRVWSANADGSVRVELLGRDPTGRYTDQVVSPEESARIQRCLDAWRRTKARAWDQGYEAGIKEARASRDTPT